MRRRTKPRVESVTQPLLLSDEFKNGVPSQPPRTGSGKRPRSRIAATQKLFLLYRYAQGFSAARVAIVLGISESSAKRILRDVRDNPVQVINLDFIVQVSSGNRPSYMCRFCSWTAAEGPAAAVHALGHLFPELDLRVLPRGGVPRPLGRYRG